MIELNLLPDIKQDFVHAQRQKRVVIVGMILTSIGSIGLVVLLGVFVLGQNVRQGIANEDIKKLSRELEDKDNLVRNLTIQNQLASISELHKTKGVYSRLFEYLKGVNPEAPNNVTLSKVTVDTTMSTISLEASAEDYQGATVFKDTLKSAKVAYVDKESGSDEEIKSLLFPEVKISGATITQDSNGNQVTSFKVFLAYEPNAFAWTIDNPSLIIPNEQTNQSASRVSIFSDAVPVKEGQ